MISAYFSITLTNYLQLVLLYYIIILYFYIYYYILLYYIYLLYLFHYNVNSEASYIFFL